jgi:ABC-type sugar transport system ATPase subunit
MLVQARGRIGREQCTSGRAVGHEAPLRDRRDNVRHEIGVVADDLRGLGVEPVDLVEQNVLLSQREEVCGSKIRTRRSRPTLDWSLVIETAVDEQLVSISFGEHRNLVTMRDRRPAETQERVRRFGPGACSWPPR